MFGAAITSDIDLNGRVVGKSERGSFFFVDENPGNCTASETGRQVTFTLAAGETKYVNTGAASVVAGGGVKLELVSPNDAKSDLAGLHYTGTPLTKY
jgi:hypothetical protein